MIQRLALIGYGEAGVTFARAGGWAGDVAVWDVAPARRELARAAGLRVGGSAAEALAGAALVLSLVTADRALAAARDYAPLLAPAAIWCDMNSVAPETKRLSAQAVGAGFVDVAVLAPVEPARLAVPLLLSGAMAEQARVALLDIGFGDARVVGAEIGQASAIKMIRSVMVKGIEALTAEMMLAAQAAGVSAEVLASLDASERPRPWARRAAYNIERMVVHGARRAAEMAEAARTLEGLGVEPVMTLGTVQRMREMTGRADLMLAGKDAA
jgi:3-hydroxyisobutyrate dehydrogenase-like beta-hydroxyacid dehydrogenase